MVADQEGLLTMACGAALAAAYVAGRLYPALDWWVFVAALRVGLIRITRRALMTALAGTPFSIETLMTIAAVGAVTNCPGQPWRAMLPLLTG